MQDDPRSLDDDVDQSLRYSAELVRRSNEVVHALDDVITQQQRVIVAADAAIERTHAVLAEVDVDLTRLERRRSEGLPPAARVLVVDDSPPIRNVLRLLVGQECGDAAEVHTASSGDEAIAAAHWLPHVVILDWHMPGLDGLQTTAQLRKLLGREVRIVLYSSTPSAEAESDALAAGADVYLEKGVDVDVLVRAVKEAVAGRDRRRAARP